MHAETRETWAAALSTLFEDEYVFVSVGPRNNSAWSADVWAVMRRDVPDPRGWAGQDGDKEHDQRTTAARKAFPFNLDSAEQISHHLHEIDVDTAAQLLVALMDDWCQISEVPGFREDPESMLKAARILLSRFAPNFNCYTNLTEARETKSPNLAARDVGPGWSSFTEYTADYGLVVVSDSEVGVFWSFNPV
ncbi:hypothetical protein ACIBCO_19420 [Streptomyces violascens]|uniref:hypothetical protein n=1 Tax=Streptomyces violascens TaxID=67381 RepID=UPI0037872A3C